MTEEEQMAASAKYLSLNILPLPEGRVALYDSFSNTEGLPLITICSVQELYMHLPSYHDLIIRNERVHATTPRDTRGPRRGSSELPLRTNSIDDL